jgi:hypothetical protein
MLLRRNKIEKFNSCIPAIYVCKYLMVVLCWGTFLRALLECRVEILKIHRKNT